MEEGPSSRPTDTPEGSAGGDEQQQNTASKPSTVKDRKCQYCNQAFTSSSLGRHLDQFLFKKKPDGIHDVEEIRRVRSGITRRQARTASSKRDSPERVTGKRPSDALSATDPSGKPRDGSTRMMFNTPTWHATGVINDLPNPSQTQDTPASARLAAQSRSGSIHLPDYASRGASSSNPDTMRALELALREVLDNIKAATSRTRPRVSPFDFDIQSQTFPSLCLQLLPPPPSLFATHPFSSPSSFPLQPPGVEHLDIVRKALRAKIGQWQSDQLSVDAPISPNNSKPRVGMDSNMIRRNAQQHEDMSLRHLELAFNHWASLPPPTRQEAWQLEITRAFAREMEKRKSLDEQLARVQQEANQLRAQVERLGSCQWPREFALFPPDTLPLPREVARELDAKESSVNPNSARWDYDNVVSKWKRVVMHDKSMGRVGVSYANPVLDDSSPQAEKPSAQPGATLSPDQSSPQAAPSASSSQHPSPYLQQEPNQSPQQGNPAKRPRLMNGNGGQGTSEQGPQSGLSQNAWPPGEGAKGE
ncbi:hypothetical protein PHISCL_03076 [Aspergillus sclerotialis]|uniref:Uncharacterized protein n=1 Tax=Aspergillus sclerotialis TaxID=2070753 RepID=A0A3A2ZMY5_9EURO|nr:hypothetical protein PHISCL_03076 [Aspergillus sclerotialis]